MARQAHLAPRRVMEEEDEVLRRPPPTRMNPDSPASARWPLEGPEAISAEQLFIPQPVTLDFKTVSSKFPQETIWSPPDSQGDVGPTQILAAANGRIKVFDKSGNPGPLNADLSDFFISVGGGLTVVDPQVRYDRLSQRWFVAGINMDIPNRIVIAVSSGAEITGSSSFTFFHFRQDLVAPAGDTGLFADYDSLGIDRFALYIGVNMFDCNCSAGNYKGSTGFVINKASLIAGTLSATAFRGLDVPGSPSPGPFAPRGVDNDDPAATEGYFIGVDSQILGRLVIRRVSNPGGTPSISGNLYVTVPMTSQPIPAPQYGFVNPGAGLDALDERLFAARIHRNGITGFSTLWTAHNIQVNSIGVASSTGGRDGSRFYEIGGLAATPVLAQAGTLFDGAASAPRFFWIPSVAMSGQGHMALGCSTSSLYDRANAATAGRFRTDPLGTIQSFSQFTSTVGTYIAAAESVLRWGDYSATGVDPNDDMTLWTFQEYCDGDDSWGVRAARLKAPPPATPSQATPPAVCTGQPSSFVTVSGTSAGGSGFYDPGPDTGGPGYPNHLAAAVTGGIGVSSAHFDSPTQVTLDLSTVGASTGLQNVTVTNPDGQSATGVGLLSVYPTPAATASGEALLCEGATLHLSATSSLPGAIFSWTGPNGFTSREQNPVIAGAGPSASGIYAVTAKVNDCTSFPATTPVTVIANGSACEDGNFCTQTDTCVSGSCAGSNPVVCPPPPPCRYAGTCLPSTGTCTYPSQPDGTACDDGNACTTGESCFRDSCTGGVLDDDDLDTHPDSACGGDDCDDTNAQVWSIPAETSGLAAAPGSPTMVTWDSESAAAGPETVYDVVTGPLMAAPGIYPLRAVCLQTGGGTLFIDPRSDPDPGFGFWYVSRGRNSCGGGTWGNSYRDSEFPACP